MANVAPKHDNGTSAGVVRAPEGFRRVGSVANAPWFTLKKGNTLRGILENMYERNDERVPKEKGGKSKFFQVKLLEGCECRSGRGEDAKVVRAEAGTVVNLNYGPKTSALADLVPSIQAGAEYEVWVHVQGDKFKISGGRTMWDMDVQQKLVKAAPALADEEPDFDGSADEAASE
jgi:hypothetical protein